MNIPILRKTITLPNLPAAAVAVGAVMPLDERGVDCLAARRLFRRRRARSTESLGDLFLRAEHRTIVDFRDATVFPRLVDRRINEVLRRNVKRSPRTARQTGRRRNVMFAERLQDRSFIRFPLVAGDQPGSLEIQAFGRVLDKCFRIVFRPLAVDDFQYEFVFGIQRDVIPIVAATSVRRIISVAIFLFLFDEVPLLVELNLFRLGGKAPRVRREGNCLFFIHHEDTKKHEVVQR